MLYNSHNYSFNDLLLPQFIDATEPLRIVNEQHLPSLPKKIKSAVIDAIDDQLTVDPANAGESLRRSLKGHRRIAIDDYRVVYRVNTVKYEVIIIAIGHRDNIYKEARNILHRH